MHSKWVFKHFHTQSGKQIYYLAALWMLGLLSGVLLCCLSAIDSVGIFHSAINTSPAPLSLFIVCVLPVVFAATALASPLFLISYLTVFLSAVFQGFSGTVIYTAVGNAAWLLRPMLLFPAGCTSVLVWWLLLQGKPGRRLHKNIRFALFLSCLIFIVDLFVVSPLIGDLAKVL